MAALEQATVSNAAQPPMLGDRVIHLPDVQVIEQQTTELSALRTWIQQLEAGKHEAMPQAIAAPAPIPPVLFAAQDAIDRVRVAATIARDGDKKPSLPEIIPGFKANSLDVRKY